MPGERIGHYRIDEKLGEGGMGVVYLGTDDVLGRKVAIKVLRETLVGDPSAKARFLREARAVAALSHPSIAVLFEAGESEAGSFLAMEFLPGRNLREELSRGPLGQERILKYSEQLASALEHAHSRGVLHRDIKTANIVLDSEDRVKLLDFGLAQIVASDQTVQTQLTSEGSWVGTLMYAAPEIITGNPASFRSDIYSLGVVMYEMACGQPPFFGLAPTSITAAILQGKVQPVSDRNSAIPKSLAMVIQKAIAARPDQRFQSATELLQSLRECVLSPTSGSHVQPVRSGNVIVVLEFQNLSGDASMDWFGTGVAETMVSDLKKVHTVQVANPDRVRAAMRTSAGVDPAALGRTLGAQWVISGSYQRGGPKLRITPRIIDVVTGELLTSNKVDGNWEDVFDLQDRVVQEVVSALNLRVDSSTMERIVAPDTRKLEAYEAYSRGRRQFDTLGKTSLEEARQSFERALQLDPDYAMAHSAIGSAYCMRYIHRTDPDDLLKAVGHLERARELDHELGEPYPWLTYAYMRQGKLDDAIRAGKTGVAFEPDLVTGRYFLGVVYMLASQRDAAMHHAAAEQLIAAIAVDPQWLPAWLVLAEVARLNGRYDITQQCAEEVKLRIAAGKGTSPFPGADCLLADVELHRGNFEKAMTHAKASVEDLSSIDHMYRETLMAISISVMAECNLRLGHIDAALGDFRRAWQMINEYPRMLGRDRVRLRVTCGLASAYAAQGEQERSRERLGEIAPLLGEVKAHIENWVFHCSLAQLQLHAAIAHLRCGDQEEALALIEQAYESGERDRTWLTTDPEFQPIRQNPRFQEVIGQIDSWVAPRFDLPDGSSTMAAQTAAMPVQ